MDWTGNTKSIFSPLGANNHSDTDRAQDDYYATDPIAIDALLDGGGEINSNVWEPACGSGELSKRLEDKGYNVYSTDLIDRGYGEGGKDFLSIEGENIWDGDIVTNPPYKYAQEFVEHGLKLVTPGNKVFMFLKLQFLEGKKRRELFNKKQLKTVWVSSKRILCAKNGDFESRKKEGSAVAYAWYEFQKGYDNDPIIKWIN